MYLVSIIRAIRKSRRSGPYFLASEATHFTYVYSYVRGSVSGDYFRRTVNAASATTLSRRTSERGFHDMKKKVAAHHHQQQENKLLITPPSKAARKKRRDRRSRTFTGGGEITLALNINTGWIKYIHQNDPYLSGYSGTAVK